MWQHSELGQQAELSSAQPSFLVVDRWCMGKRAVPCCCVVSMLPCPVQLKVPSLLLSIHMWWWPGSMQLVYGVKQPDSTDFSSLHFSLSASLLSQVILSRMPCPRFPHLSGSGAGWRSPQGEARSLPAPSSAAFLFHCLGLPGGQLIPPAIQSSLRY